MEVKRNGMLNYGPEDLSWKLWHEDPVFDEANVVLVHGYKLPLFSAGGRYNAAFGRLGDLLQTREGQYNVWQFEYMNGFWGTVDRITTYVSRLEEAVNRIGRLTGKSTCSIVAYSMGGIIARKYVAMGGRSRVDRLLTLATPHMGMMQPVPFDLQLTGRFVPGAVGELRPDSGLLWDLNTEVDSSTAPEFAAVGGYSWGHTDGLIEIGSASLVKSDTDGSIAERLYFTGVNRSHLNINDIRDNGDEVFQLICRFLRGGLAGISRLRPAEEPGYYDGHPFLTFALRRNPRRRRVYPFVIVKNTEHRYSGYRVFSQGARTEDGSYIFTVRLQPDDEGEAEIHYARGEYATVQVHRGQSTIVTEPLGAGPTMPEPILSGVA